MARRPWDTSSCTVGGLDLFCLVCWLVDDAIVGLLIAGRGVPREAMLDARTTDSAGVIKLQLCHQCIHQCIIC